jgi:hypothetical protein
MMARLLLSSLEFAKPHSSRSLAREAWFYEQLAESKAPPSTADYSVYTLDPDQ